MATCGCTPGYRGALARSCNRSTFERRAAHPGYLLLTLLEVLVVPYRVGNIELAERYEAVLTRSRGVRMLDLSRDHLRLAAQVRAATGAATPDALQLAASVGTRCSAFVTNDRRLPTVPGLRIIQLGAFVV